MIHERVVSTRDWRLCLRRVWTRHCPRCAAATLFESGFRLAEQCATCGLIFRREAGAMTGQMYLSAVVTEVFAAALVLAVFWGTDWTPSASIAVCVPIVVVFSYWFLPRAMALWVAIEYLTDLGNGEAWVADAGTGDAGIGETAVEDGEGDLAARGFRRFP